MAVRKINIKEDYTPKNVADLNVNNANLEKSFHTAINNLKDIMQYLSEMDTETIEDLWTEEEVKLCNALARTCLATVDIIRNI